MRNRSGGTKLKIERIEIIRVKYPWGPSDRGEDRVWPLLLIHTDTGLTGMGRGGNPDLIEREFSAVLLGEDPRMRARLWQRLYEISWRFGGPGNAAMSTIGALDIALWDLYGKACGEPVWRLLGASSSRVDAYGDGIGYVSQDADTVAALVAKHADLGFKSIKFHLKDPDPDLALEKVIKSRTALGDDRRLMIDIHRMWDGNLAVQMARAFEPYGLFWLEEPVRSDDEPGFMRMVREATSALIAGGEGEGTLYGIRRLIVEGGLQVVQSDILGGGGFTGLLRMAAVAEAHHVWIAPHGASYPELNAHFLAAVPNRLMAPACPHTEPYQIWSKLYWPAFEIHNGEIELTDRPGLGLEFDTAFIEQYAV